MGCFGMGPGSSLGVLGEVFHGGPRGPGSWCGVPEGSWGVLGAPCVLLGGLWGFGLVDFFDVVHALRSQGGTSV